MLSTDPVNIALDADGDLDLSSGDLALNSGIAGTDQGIASALRFIRGEAFYDRAAGVPYLESDYVTATEALLGSKFRADYARDIFAAAITAVPNVTSLLSLTVDFNPSTRAMSVAWKVRSTFGDTEGVTEL